MNWRRGSARSSRVCSPVTDALALLDVMSDVKRLASAAETLLAARVAETDAWREGSADRSAAHWLARRTGISIADAKAKLETAAHLSDLPATAEAFRAGRLSDQQAREVVAGATADPQAEHGLVGYGGVGFVEGTAERVASGSSRR